MVKSRTNPSGPAGPDTLLEQALAHHRAGRPEQAAALYEQLLSIQPDHPLALESYGVLAIQHRQDALAVALHARLTALPGATATHWHRLGMALSRTGRQAEALEACRKAVAIDSSHADAWAALGSGCEELGQLAEAESALRRALTLAPGMPFAVNALGMVLRKAGRMEEAVAALAPAAVPGAPAELFNTMGNALADLGRYPQAVEAFAAAVRQAPQMAAAHANMGGALAAMGRFGDAVTAYQSALRLQPGLADAWVGLGQSLERGASLPAAAEAFESALAAAPNHPEALPRLVHAQLKLCRWGKPLDAHVAALRTRADVPYDPMIAVAVEPDPHRQLENARAFVQARYGELAAHPLPPMAMSGGGKTRIGYLSPDFADHPVAHLLARVLELHNRERFECFGYALTPDDGSPLRKRMERSVDRFADLTGEGAQSAAQRIRTDRIDILIDLAGHTRDARMEILALRPAPVQVTWLGFAGTTGAEFVDYLIGDRISTPPELSSAFSENLVRLPHCLMPTDDTREVAAMPSRGDFGLPGSGTVFACFNKAHKVTADVFDRWMAILAGVPGSVLWLAGYERAAQDAVREWARQAGIDPARVIFAGRVADGADHLARLGLADLFLDTTPYNAHATAVDALWAGVPVLTVPGESMAARIAASLLTAAGLTDLIVPDAGAYVETAIRLGNDRAALDALKERARACRTSPAFDPAGFVMHLERAFDAMAERSRGGEPPSPMEVEI
ncbi:MAG: tetratricopeptide repeat protein [Nitrospirota bacterium]|nr:tetratricopeptide repeat protein [Nitrospirota bacterium]